MNGEREQMLRRIREAVAAGNRAGHACPLPERGGVGYQGAGPDPVARFAEELTAAGGQAHLVPDRAAARAVVLQLLQERSVRRVLLGRGSFLDTVGLDGALRAGGFEVEAVDALPADGTRGAFFAADAGVSGVDYLIAETGSLALLSRPDQPRSLSLLPPVHIAVAGREQILPDLFDLFATPLAASADSLPSSVSLITGPSKTGDIELRLVTGVHGPGEVHVVLVTQEQSAHS